MKKNLYLIALLIALASCEDKTLEEVVVTPPVFTFKGTLDGQELNLAVGENNYQVVFDTQQDFFGIYNYNCQMAPSSCSNCGPALQIKIYGLEEKGPNDLPNYANDLAVGEKDYLVNFSSTNNLSYHFFANENNNTLNHYWNFGDGQISTQTNPDHNYAAAGTYEVIHTIENAQNVSTSTSFTLEVGQPNSFCSLPFRVNETEPNEFDFHHPFNMPDFLNCQTWTIYNDEGDVLLTTNQNSFEYNLPQGQVYEVCLSFINELTNCEGSYCQTIDNTQPGPFFDPGFQIAPEPIMPVIGKVLVEYRDANGQLYHSALNTNHDSIFEILESAFYTPTNSNAPITRKLAIALSCDLVNANNPSDVLQLENAQAVFAFEIE